MRLSFFLEIACLFEWFGLLYSISLLYLHLYGLLTSEAVGDGKEAAHRSSISLSLSLFIYMNVSVLLWITGLEAWRGVGSILKKITRCFFFLFRLLQSRLLFVCIS